MKIDWLTHCNGLEVFTNVALTISGCMPNAVFYVTLEPHGTPGSVGAYGDEKAFCVTRNAAELEMDFIVEICGNNGLLFIEDIQTGKTIWQREIRESLIFTQPVGPLKRGHTYVLRLISTSLDPIRITISSQDSLVREIFQASQSSKQPCPA